jgi:hypothetical protein
MPKRNSNPRGMFNSHRGAGAGKGDAPRYKHDAKWVENFSEIDFHRDQPDGFTKLSEKRLRKKYGTLRARPEFIEHIEPDAGLPDVR